MTDNSFLDDAPYRDAALPTAERVADLLERMTRVEKIAQLTAPFASLVDTHNPPPEGFGVVTATLCSLRALPPETAQRANALQRKHVEDSRLGIPVIFAEEALVGFKVRDATMFPEAIAQASTWNPGLIAQMAQTIGEQMVSVGARQALSPLADVARDPRWGRVGETYGEDPYLVGRISSAFVQGLQSSVPGTPVIATLKHFLGYGASDGGRNTETASVGTRALREIYGRPFEMAIREGGAGGVMPSYNDLDGEPVSGSRALLTDLLRDQYGFTGLVISDLGAIPQLHTKHRTSDSMAGAYAQAIRAGMDLALDVRVSSDHITAAVESGLLDEAELDRAVASVLRAKFELGLFEAPYVDEDSVPETLDPPAARDLARTIAEQSLVLLQNRPVNERPLLPLSPTVTSIAVIGPNADRPLGQLGHYSYHVLDSMTELFAEVNDPTARAADAPDLSDMSPDDAHLRVESVPIVTFLEGIRTRAGEGIEVTYAKGSGVASDDRSGFGKAAAIAQAADIAVVVVGDQSGVNSLGTVGEGLDSSTVELPGVQRELVEEIVATGTPTIVVLSHGRPFALNWMAETVPAIITSWFGGEEAGNALARMLFGDISPAGRLPIAFLESPSASPVPYSRSLEGPAYVDGSSARALYPFGHGLSYTTFEYSDLMISTPEVPTDGSIELSFDVTNSGDRFSDEVVQVYGFDVHARTVRPVRQLLAFERITLAPGDSDRVSVEIPTDLLALWDSGEGWVVEPGRVELFIGSSSADVRLRGAVDLVGGYHRPIKDRSLSSRVTTICGEPTMDKVAR
ncbi:glycoside hydrolase family 3 N-terminal domain-containing protein [Microbacterium oleivorans]|uniref:Exo-alpha-(1->6)-L-arabinopyranosidase n=1 Tax=Microbacterium oleivorans TaxID=273677 RepID=A0A4R5YL30_9MICO|nr:glycoside hydrolase family 3 N-terminal domain-containing protein [Microbacterium oleivorans]TDL45252.1 beta-glucosidase [Microbacterium oleivorans]